MSPTPLIPAPGTDRRSARGQAPAGTQVQPPHFEFNSKVEPYDLGPGLRRDERFEGYF